MLTRLSPETTGCILRNTTATVAVILLVYLNLFQGIGTNSIRNWDEARHGVNALEMIRSGNYLVHTYEGETDYWNLKPPLSFVTMIAGFKIFGANVLGLRFFSALCSLLSCITLVALCRKLRGADYGLCALLTLLTCDWYFSHHNAITGDPEAMYI